MTMSSLQCIVGEKEVRAGLQGPGTVVFRATAGVLTVAGSTRDSPIRGLEVDLSGTEQRSAFDSKHVRWLNASIPTETPIRVSVDLTSTNSTPATRQVLAPPSAVEREFRKCFDELDRRFSKKKPSALPPAPEPGEPVALGRCSHCLAVHKNDRHLVTIGTPWMAAAKIMLTVPDSGEPTCGLDLVGYDGEKPFTWGSSPLLDGDSIALSFLDNAVPEPARIVPPDPHLSQRMAIALYNELGRLFRGENPDEP